MGDPERQAGRGPGGEHQHHSLVHGTSQYSNREFIFVNLSITATVISVLQPAPPAMSYQLGAYGNQPVTMAPPGMPGAQMYYGGGYAPGYPQQQPAPAPGLVHVAHVK